MDFLPQTRQRGAELHRCCRSILPRRLGRALRRGWMCAVSAGTRCSLEIFLCSWFYFFFNFCFSPMMLLAETSNAAGSGRTCHKCRGLWGALPLIHGAWGSLVLNNWKT